MRKGLIGYGDAPRPAQLVVAAICVPLAALARRTLRRLSPEPVGASQGSRAAGRPSA